MKLNILIPTLALALSPIVSADHHGEKKEAPAKPKADVEIKIECNDNMQFDKKEFEVPAGKVVSLTLVNVGKQPKLTMGHNLVILKKDVQPPAFAMTAMQARDNEYIPKVDKDKSQVVAHTKLLGPGESHTITFTAPAAGTYDYLCTFPGHFGVMKGKMIVK